MFRFSHPSIAIGLLAFASLPLGFGCHVIAGLEDRDVTGGAGGMSSSSGEVATVSSSGGGAGGGIPDFLCPSLPPSDPNCENAVECSIANKTKDPCHCGDCDIQCGQGTPCVNGICSPKPLFQLPNIRISRAAVNGGAVYFAAYDEDLNLSDIRVVSFDGQLVTTRLNSNPIPGDVAAIDADCDNIYYATVPNGAMVLPSLWSLPLKGGTPTPIPKPIDQDVGQPEKIAHDSVAVYWTDALGVGIWKIGDQMASQRIPSEPGFKAIGLAVEGSDLFWTEVENGNMQSHLHRATINPDGTVIPDTDFLTYSRTLRHIAMDSANIYMLAYDDAAGPAVRYVQRGNLKDMVSSYLIPPPIGYSLGDPIFADNSDDYVYFLAVKGGTGATHRVKKPGAIAGGNEIPTPQFDEQWLVGTESRLYLVTPKNGESGQIDWVGR